MRNFKEANQFIVALQQHWKQQLLPGNTTQDDSLTPLV